LASINSATTITNLIYILIAYLASKSTGCTQWHGATDRQQTKRLNTYRLATTV